MILTGISALPPHKLITKVGRNKDKRVEWRHEEDVVSTLRQLKEDGYSIFAVE